jgi:putative FmdB family regulatory protein
MKILFSFKCTSCSTSFEKLTEYTKETECPSCGGVAEYSGSFPGAAAKWEKKHLQQAAKEKKQNAA